MTIPSTAAVLLVVAWLGAVGPVSVDDEPDADVVAIYEEVLQQEHLYLDGMPDVDARPQIVLAARTGADYIGHYLDARGIDDDSQRVDVRRAFHELCRRGERTLRFMPAALEDFIDAARAPSVSVPPLDFARAEIVPTTAEELRARADVVGWARAHEEAGIDATRYAGTMGVSNIGFGPDRRYALVYAELGPVGYLFSMVKLPIGWRVRGHVGLWVS